MARARLANLLILLAAMASPFPARGQQGFQRAPVLRINRVDTSGPPQVALYFTDLDASAHVVSRPEKDYALLVNGLPQGELAYLKTFSALEEPMVLVLVVQVSPSMADALPEIKKAGKRLLKALEGRAQTGLVAYTDVTEETVKPTSPKELAAKLESLKIKEDALSVQMPEAIRDAMEQLGRAKLPKQRLMVVVSDGLTADLRPPVFADLGLRASQQGINIHSIGYAPLEPGRLRTLYELSKTGRGTFREASTPDALAKVFQDLQEEIQGQVVARYKLPTVFDGKEYDLEIKVAGSQISDIITITLPRWAPPKEEGPWLVILLVGGGVALLLVTTLVIALLVRRSRAAAALAPAEARRRRRMKEEDDDEEDEEDERDDDERDEERETERDPSAHRKRGGAGRAQAREEEDEEDEEEEEEEEDEREEDDRDKEGARTERGRARIRSPGPGKMEQEEETIQGPRPMMVLGGRPPDPEEGSSWGLGRLSPSGASGGQVKPHDASTAAVPSDLWRESSAVEQTGQPAPLPQPPSSLPAPSPGPVDWSAAAQTPQAHAASAEPHAGGLAFQIALPHPDEFLRRQESPSAAGGLPPPPAPGGLPLATPAGGAQAPVEHVPLPEFPLQASFATPAVAGSGIPLPPGSNLEIMPSADHVEPIGAVEEGGGGFLDRKTQIIVSTDVETQSIMAWIVPLDDPGLNTVRVKDDFVLGSDPGCDFVVRGQGVEPRHAILDLDPQGFWLRWAAMGREADSASRLLHDNDRFRVGNREFLFKQATSISEMLRAPVRLEVLEGLDQGRTLALKNGTPYAVGSHPSCALTIRGEGIGLRHVIVLRKQDICIVEDLGSPGGVHFAGAPVGSKALRAGQEITLGKIRVMFIIEE